MNMKLIGHASVLISEEGFNLITDPWFGYDFHFGTFYSYPQFFPPTPEELKQIHAIHISHIHKDHLCVKSLELLPKNVEVIIANHSDKTFRNKIERQGFSNIVEIDPYIESVNVGPFNIRTFTPEKFDGSFDSAAMISDSDSSFYFMNDCRLSAEQYQLIKKLYPKVQGCFLNYNSVSPYPTCYEFKASESSNASTASELERTTEIGLKHFALACHTLGPSWVVPYAGDLRFRRSDIFQHNRIFEGLPARLATMFDGDQLIKVNHRDQINEDGYVTLCIEKKPAQLEEIEIDEVIEAEKFTKLGSQFREILEEFFNRNAKNWSDPMTVSFRVNNGEDSKEFIFSSGEALDSAGGPDLLVEYSAQSLIHILNSEMTFQNIHYAYRFRATICNRKVYQQCFIHRWQ